jgi:hypothetical protein
VKPPWPKFGKTARPTMRSTCRRPADGHRDHLPDGPPIAGSWTCRARSRGRYAAGGPRAWLLTAPGPGPRHPDRGMTRAADPDRPVIAEAPARDARGHGQDALRLPRREAAELPVDRGVPGLGRTGGGCAPDGAGSRRR